MAKKDNVLKDMQGDLPAYKGDPNLIPNQSFAKTNGPAFSKVVEARRSIRVYDGKRIPESTVKLCLKEATLAPSSSNLQPYQVYWLKSDEIKKAGAYACLKQPAATTAGELFAIVMRGDLWKQNLNKLVDIMTESGKTELSPSVKSYYRSLIPKIMSNDPLGIQNMMRRIGFTLAGLKGPIVRTPVNRGDHRVWGHVQAALVAENLMLSLTAHGYDTCPMGGFDEARIKKLLKLPAKAEVTMMISAGNRKPEGLYGPRYRLDSDDLIKII
ncbi:MAG: nitroreductase family protein [Pseudobacteriovorax sp.]|nr:nitroreductase family protein [Pseudobacteriovorax sp.]